MIGSGGQAQMDIACRQAGRWTFDIQHAKEYNEPFVNHRVFESWWLLSTYTQRHKAFHVFYSNYLTINSRSTPPSPYRYLAQFQTLWLYGSRS